MFKNIMFKKPNFFKFILKLYLALILFFYFMENYLFIDEITCKKIGNKFFPKISVFMPIYNRGQYLNRSIGSIQKQTLKDIEIISVNDYSTDNSLKILKEMAKNDSRIKIISNNKNHGSLYSRAMGILKSKGEYLINLDPDDEFKDSDNLEYLYNTAKKSNSDVVRYTIMPNSDSFPIIQCSNIHHILKQPELFKSIFGSNNRLNDYYITNKFIKREILLKAYLSFKNKIHSEKWNYHEDNIWSILINKYAQSMRCVDKIIYLYYLNDNSAMLNRGNLLELKNLLYRHEMFKEIFINKKEKKYLIAEYFELKSLIEDNLKFNSILNNNTQIKIRIIL